MFTRFQSQEGDGEPVVLNVYDLVPQFNDKIAWAGLGIYHSGVEVYGIEYGFGGHPFGSSGIFQSQSQSPPLEGLVFREAVLLGRTNMSPDEVTATIAQMGSDQFVGKNYQLLSLNCNVFSDTLSVRLVGKGIPGWVNRMAWLGTMVPCVLPYVGIDPTAPSVPMLADLLGADGVDVSLLGSLDVTDVDVEVGVSAGVPAEQAALARLFGERAKQMALRGIIPKCTCGKEDCPNNVARMKAVELDDVEKSSA